MKKTRNLFLFLLMSIALSGYSQDFKMFFSQTQKVKSTVTIASSGKIGDKIFVTKSDVYRGKYSIMRFDKSLGLEKEVLFKEKSCKTPNCIGKDYDFIETLYLKDKLLLFFQSYERKTKNRMLFCQKMDLDGKFVGQLTKIDNIEAKKKSNSGSFFIEYSEDSTKFLVVKSLPYKKREDEKFVFKVYDSDLNNLSNSQLTLPYMDKDASVIDYYLSNKGDVFMLLNVDIENKKKKKGEDDQFYSLLCLNASTDNSLAEYRVQLPKKNIVDISFRVDNDHESVLCAGFYSDIKTSAKRTKDIDGFFYLSVDVNSKKMKSQSYKELDPEIIKQLMGKKKSKKLKEGKGISKTFVIKDFVKRSDGSSVIVAENRWTQVVQNCTTTQYGTTSCTTSYHYHRDNIFSISISPDGDVLSFFDIAKKQASINDGGVYSSYLLYQKGDRVFFLFNDNLKNLDASMKTIRDVKTMGKLKKTGLFAVELLPDGSCKKQLLVKNKDYKMMVRPERGVEIAKGIYVAPITTVKSKKLGFVRFELN